MKSENLIRWDDLSLGQEILCFKCSQSSSQIKIVSKYEQDPAIIIQCACGAKELLYRCNTPGCDSYILGGEGYETCQYCKNQIK